MDLVAVLGGEDLQHPEGVDTGQERQAFQAYVIDDETSRKAIYPSDVTELADVDVLNSVAMMMAHSKRLYRHSLRHWCYSRWCILKLYR